jgi:hypothetical protein
MGEGVQVDITANAQAYEQALQRLGQLQSQFEQKLRGVGETSKKVSREERELNRARLRVLQQIMTPQEKYNQKVGELDRLLKSNKLSQDQYNRAVGQAKQHLDEVGQSGEKAFGAKAIGFARELAGAIGLGGGIAGAVGLLRSEYESLIEVQRTANQLSMTAAQAQEAALTNLGATTIDEREKFVAEVGAMASQLGVSESDVYKRASDALSARGDKPVYGPGGAMDAVKASYGFAPGDMAAGIAGAGAALDISAVTGGTAEQSLGFLQAVGQKARITDPKKLAVNLPPALTAAMASGADPQTAAAMFAALTQGMADPTGESSRTASISLSQELRKFEGGGDAWATLSMRDRIAKLQSDPELQKQFFADASFEKRAQAPIEQLLAGTGMAGRSYQQFLGNLPNMEESGRFFNESTAVKRGADLQVAASFDRALKGAKESLATADPKRAMLGALREEFQPILKQAGMMNIDAKLTELGTDARGGNVGQFITELRDLAEARDLMNKAIESGKEIVTVGKAPEFDPLSRQQANILTELANVLSTLNQASTKLDRAAEERRLLGEAMNRLGMAAEKLDSAAGKLDRNAAGGPTLTGPRDD